MDDRVVVAEFETVRTERLILTPVGLNDLDAMAELHADPVVWHHFPSGRHRDRDRDQTRAYLAVGLGGTCTTGYARKCTVTAWPWSCAGAALDAAHAVASTLPVTAFLLEPNLPSRATAERVGLQLAWRGPDAGNLTRPRYG